MRVKAPLSDTQDTLLKVVSIGEESIAKPIDYDTSKWTELTVEQGIELDLRYSTSNNFTESIIYPCGRCFVRPDLAIKLLEIQAQIKLNKGYTIKLFDCYRPKPAQQRLWDIVPNATYVANPSKGSMHNKGLAIDLTLVNLNSGQELDMGTDFDFFGPEARPAYTGFSNEVLQNRAYLQNLMKTAGFNTIKSEWWHFSLNGTGHKQSDWEWSCPD